MLLFAACANIMKHIVIHWNGTQSKFDIGSFERKNLGNSQNIMFPVVIVDKS